MFHRGESMKYSLRSFIPHAVGIYLRRTLQFVDTCIARVYAIWWGLEVGKGTIFCGIPIFRRHPTANIVVGTKCQFKSAEWSNTIGLNRRCVLSALKNSNIEIGNQCGFSGTVIAASNSIVIGDRVLCGGNCTIVDTDRHPIDLELRVKNAEAEAIPINIEDDVFLGMNVIVLKGSNIGRGTVVAANSVVTGHLPSGVIAGGVPARVIREIARDESDLAKE